MMPRLTGIEGESHGKRHDLAAHIHFRNGNHGGGMRHDPRKAGRDAKSLGNEKLNIAGIGIGGKGESDVAGAHAAGDNNIVALCDVDWKQGAKSFEAFPQARQYWDFREMLEKEYHNIDAVTISTPDHMHAPAAIAAMELGKHVYVQKPLTHDIYEARRLKELAIRYKVATQMGNQGTAARAFGVCASGSGRAPSATCGRRTSGLTGPFGCKESIGQRKRSRFRRHWTGTFGWGQRRSVRIIGSMRRSHGAVVGFRLRGARRYGVPYHGPGLYRAQIELSEDGGGRVGGRHRRDLSQFVHHYLRVRGA